MMLRSLQQYTRCIVYVGLFFIVFLFSASVALAQPASESFTIGLQMGEDTDPPTVPADVTATPIAETQIDVAWSASTDVYRVTGYQVFRDNVQITTTADTTYSDTGLTASTTYNYTIRAFDGAGNVSSSSVPVATTTFATPPPPVTPTTTPQAQMGTLLPLAELTKLEITTGTQAAEIEFSTTQPVRYVLRYGVAEALDDGILETIIYKRDHTVVLPDLLPVTTYYYELHAHDRFGRAVVLQRATFDTMATAESAGVTNINYFVGDVIDDDVVLRWGLPTDSDVEFVRIVRNERFFPQSPTDGVVMYEGSAQAYTDTQALESTERQYYTLFAYTLSGQFSSGRVLRVSRVPRDPAVINPDTEDPDVAVERPVPPVSTGSIAETGLSIVQGRETYNLVERQFTIRGNQPFQFRVSAEALPQFTRGALVTVYQTENPQNFYTYVLQNTSVSGYYQGQLPALTADSEYSFVLRAYSLSGELLDTFEGGILTRSVSAPVSAGSIEESLPSLGFGYALVGFAFGVLLMWILATLLRFTFNTRIRS